MHALISWLNNLHAFVRLVFCLAVAILLFFVFDHYRIETLTAVMLSWLVFCICLISISWITFITVPLEQLRKESNDQDQSKPVIFVLILCIICISLVGVVLLMRPSEPGAGGRELHHLVALAGVAISWILLHTLFTLHYARIYYSLESADPCIHNGLDFPSEDAPEYLDFAYFSFVVGMTFQVSDVVVNTKLMRKVVLLHGILSFIFNTTILALSISIVPNLGK